MKIIFNLISVFMVVVVIVLAALNTNVAFDFTVWMVKGAKIIYNVALAKVILGFFIMGLLTGVFWAVAYYTPAQKKLKEYQRKLEKTSVQSDEESSKVAVLEAKIQTLETALKSALENKE